MANEDVKKLSDDVGELKAGFTKIADTLTDLVRQRGQEAKEKFEGVKQKIHEDPVTAVVAAFGIGLLIGILFGRR